MKTKVAIIALSGAMLANGVAVGMDFDPKFYVGGEAQYNKLKEGSAWEKDANGRTNFRKKNVPGADLFLGSRLTENVGVEAGYSILKQSKNTFATSAPTDTASLNVKMRNMHLDALAYLPVANDIDLIGSIGLGRLSTKVTEKLANGTVDPQTAEEKKLAKTKTGIRLGLGAQYMFDTNFGARFMVRHQKGNKVVKNVNSAGLGLFYQF